MPSQEETITWLKAHAWSLAAAVLLALVAWQGLTLRTTVQSWSDLDAQIRALLSGKTDEIQGESAAAVSESVDRQVTATFFYRPHVNYELTAIMGARAVINGSEVKVGDRVGDAVVQKIQPASVSLLEDGKTEQTVIEIHPG